MNRLLTGSLALGLMLAVASCGSDSTSSTTAASTTTVAVGDTTAADDTAAVTNVPTSTSGNVAAAGKNLKGAQAKVYALGMAEASEEGATVDAKCFAAVVAQLSDADAQKIVDTDGNADPELSPEGQALGEKANDCVTDGAGGTATATPETVGS